MRYLRLVGTRLVQAIPVLIGITIVTFILVHAIPGDPARTIGGLRATPEILANIRARLGTDQPLINQYFSYIGQLIRGDLGVSYISGASVNSLLGARLPITIMLIAYAAFLALAIGVPIAMVSAVRTGSMVDAGLRGVLVVTLGIPSFWFGLLLIAYPALRWGWFPSGGVGDSVISNLYHLFLPALTLSVTFLAVLVRSLRASLIEVLTAEYVSLARMKGISVSRLYLQHILRNGLRPAITIVGLNASYLLGASVIVESIFAINGVGKTMLDAILQRDIVAVQSITLVFGILVLLISFLVDLAQTTLDPRRH